MAVGFSGEGFEGLIGFPFPGFDGLEGFLARTTERRTREARTVRKSFKIVTHLTVNTLVQYRRGHVYRLCTTGGH